MEEILQRLRGALRYGAARDSRVKWIIGAPQCYTLYATLLNARILEQHGPAQIDPWVSMTPFGVDMARNWNRLVKKLPQTVEVKNMKKRKPKKTVKVPIMSMSELVWGGK